MFSFTDLRVSIKLDFSCVHRRIPQVSLFAASLFLLPFMAGCKEVSQKQESGLLTILNDKGEVAKEDRVFSPIDLRGYGLVSGKSWKFSDEVAKASILQIDCQDEEKAKLTQAKYLSDLQVLPGVKKTSIPAKGGEASGYVIEGQGSILAFRSGKSVFILAGNSNGALEKLLAKHIQGNASKSYNPEVEVPMWLDRWDRFGFRFYYSRPFLTPPDKTSDTYNPAEEFEFAAKLGRPGFLFWNEAFHADTAEGLTTENQWNWAMAECVRLKLPVGMQLNYVPQTWLANRYREETRQKMPGFCGDRFDIVSDFDGGQGLPSWCGEEIGKVARSQMQASVRYWNQFPNITSWNHPDSEFQHGFDQMMEYGPVADISYRVYLKENYGNLETVAERWTGDPKGFTSWDQVRVPEFAHFAGWGPSAFDLTGDWHVKFQDAYIEGKQSPPPPEWLAEGFDDSAWPVLPAPGHDRAMFLLKDDPARPKWSRQRFQQAVYRRDFDLPSDWQEKNPKTWLYVWDFNVKWGASISAYVNGQKAGEEILQHGTRHWFAMDVTEFLHKGANQVSLVLPDGSLGYRVYLSPTPPARHPYFNKELNEQWVDFTGWLQWSRLKSLEESVGMIRQVDPNRGISFMDKNGYAFWRAGTKRLCVKYGGEIHNSGYMGGIWADDMSMLSRSSGLPVSVEPGEPAADSNGLLNLLGLYSVEGVQGIDYFQHISDIMWPTDVRQTFEENWKLFELFGKYHSPKAEVAILLAGTRWQMCEYTADSAQPAPNLNLPFGFWNWNVGALIAPEFNRDAVDEYDFEDGNAEKYKIILDTNSAIMDEKYVSEIERYVRNGGIFVTFVQTGRHSPIQHDAWPISRLTGYKVTEIDSYLPDGDLKEERAFELVPGQTVFPADQWKSAPLANGLSLQKEAEGCVDLMRWSDGSVAIGMRPLGKGYIVQVGAKFASTSIWRGHSEWTARLFENILDHFGIARVPATISGVDNAPFSDQRPDSVPPAEKHARTVMLSSYLSNNGLYDVWTLWNSTKEPVSLEFHLDKSNEAKFYFDVKSGAKLSIDQIHKLTFSPRETKVFLVPRNTIEKSPEEWFALQLEWWRGTEKPLEETLPEFKPRFAMDLSPDWKFIPITTSDQIARVVAGEASEEKNAAKRRLGIWGLNDSEEVKHAVFTKEITIPQEWLDGEVRLWFLFDHGQANVTYVPAFLGEAKISVDGKVVRDFQTYGVSGMKMPDFKAGTTHRLTVEIKGSGPLRGLKGGAWLNFVPKPTDSIDLAGEWQASDDALNYDKKLQFPGEWNAYLVKRTIEIPENAEGKNVVVHLEFQGDGPQGVMINGKWIRKSFQIFGSRLDFNITPWVKFGELNEIELGYASDGRGQGPGNFSLQHVSLDLFEPGVFP